MAEKLENLQQIFIVFEGSQSEEYYFDNQRNTLGKFMEEGWGHFYHSYLGRWEFINMQKIVKIYYGNQ